ncbi:uncharacterized protein LACBIDRAFT_333838 [Laccaria bicolor S238N-H82]|uniref:Predicted protein n=1 Tax=Laccaria bicolor (strain S238N-H82 / ATCC MYA-4686) TaxID=486041 RepID=B0DX86_LACBS|nr:uncharacterized protein LACBIDRAFT_333838 [Laccaria bicolor S238N-H82]EDR00748.1 predicted protein [Laccaria bicolor S238N-H82]|eukprot:XP_001888540.1 predicted protein [Laccaria bicolor S238N-H82]
MDRGTRPAKSCVRSAVSRDNFGRTRRRKRVHKELTSDPTHKRRRKDAGGRSAGNERIYYGEAGFRIWELGILHNTDGRGRFQVVSTSDGAFWVHTPVVRMEICRLEAGKGNGDVLVIARRQRSQHALDDKDYYDIDVSSQVRIDTLGGFQKTKDKSKRLHEDWSTAEGCLQNTPIPATSGTVKSIYTRVRCTQERRTSTGDREDVSYHPLWPNLSSRNGFTSSGLGLKLQAGIQAGSDGEVPCKHKRIHGPNASGERRENEPENKGFMTKSGVKDGQPAISAIWVRLFQERKVSELLDRIPTIAKSPQRLPQYSYSPPIDDHEGFGVLITTVISAKVTTREIHVSKSSVYSVLDKLHTCFFTFVTYEANLKNKKQKVDSAGAAQPLDIRLRAHCAYTLTYQAPMANCQSSDVYSIMQR